MDWSPSGSGRRDEARPRPEVGGAGQGSPPRRDPQVREAFGGSRLKAPIEPQGIRKGKENSDPYLRACL